MIHMAELRNKAGGYSVITQILEFILILIVLIDCNSVYRASTEILVDLQTWGLVGANAAVGALLLLHLWQDRTKWEIVKQHGGLFLLFLFFTFEFSAVNAIHHHPQGFFGYFLFFVNGLILLFRFYEKDGEAFRLLYLLEHVVLFLAVASFLLWIGSSVLELWGRNPDIKVSWGGFYSDSNYLNLCIRRWWYKGDVKKNLGIFIEPPMYGLFLGFGLYTELFLKKKSNICVVIIFILTLFSNRAVLALMLAMGALFFQYLEMSRGKKLAKVLTPIALVLLVVGGVTLILYKQRVGWGSFATHIDDFAAALKCWMKYPILGCGYDNEIPIKELMSEFRAHNQGLSNSAAVVLAEGGIVLFSYYAIPFLILMLAYFRGNRRLAYWAVGMFLFWVVVIFHIRLFIFFLLAFGYATIEFKVNLKEAGWRNKVHFSVHYFRENQSEDKGYLSFGFPELPMGFVVVMGLILNGLAVYGILSAGHFSVRNLSVSVAIIILEVGGLIILHKRKSVTLKHISFIQIGLWAVYMLFGQAYQVLNEIYAITGLHIQTCWYRFLIVVLCLYSFGVLVDVMYNDSKGVCRGVRGKKG